MTTSNANYDASRFSKGEDTLFARLQADLYLALPTTFHVLLTRDRNAMERAEVSEGNHAERDEARRVARAVNLASIGAEVANLRDGNGLLGGHEDYQGSEALDAFTAAIVKDTMPLLANRLVASWRLWETIEVRQGEADERGDSSNRSAWLRGWDSWVNWGCREDTLVEVGETMLPTCVTAGWDRAADINESGGGSRPERSEGREDGVCPYPRANAS